VTASPLYQFYKEKGPSEFFTNGPSLGRKRPRRAAKREPSSHIALQKLKVQRIIGKCDLRRSEGLETRISRESPYFGQAICNWPAKGHSNKERPSEIERPKSREETPKLGSNCDEACQRNHLVTMSCFDPRRNLYEYYVSTLTCACIRPATTYVTNVYLAQDCSISK
jgi:hypothetical protein